MLHQANVEVLLLVGLTLAKRLVAEVENMLFKQSKFQLMAEVLGLILETNVLVLKHQTLQQSAKDKKVTPNGL